MATASSSSFYSLAALFFFLVLGLWSCSTVLAVDYIADVALAARHQRWMDKFGRVYKDAEERQRRFEVFRKNLKYIEDFNNAGYNTYRLGLNEFSDMTSEEFAVAHTCVIPHLELRNDTAVEQQLEISNKTGRVAAPDFVDWRQQGAVNTPKRQLHCASCWAFASTGAVEGLIKINYNVLLDLSPQQLVDCDPSSNGCNGGSAYDALDYIAQHGITTEAMYPYTGVKGDCRNEQPVVWVRGAAAVKRNDEAALMEAVARQPIVAAITNSDALQHYQEGLFIGPCGPKIDHSVLIVGYGTSMAFNYWIVKNSWGTWWGVGGYMYMLRDSGSPSGLCGIAAYPYYPMA